MRLGKALASILFIPDGSRRGARKAGMSYIEAYRVSSLKVDMAVKFFLAKDEITSLTVYGLSYDNLVRRDSSEINLVLQVQEERYKKWLKDPFFHLKRVRVIFYGNMKLFFEYLPPSYIEAMQELEEKTQNYEWKSLFILIGHSGRKEVVNRGQSDRPAPPEIDLIVRTGGAARLSDVLPFQTAYAEMYVIDKLITEIDVSDLSMALDALAATMRNFGA